MAIAPKHVIFLGAGASVSSGYPLGDDLRKIWLASAGDLKKQVLDLVYGKENRIRTGQHPAQFDNWVQPLAESLKLFRNGCFGTIDEFCYLMRETKVQEVANLKNVLRLVLGLHNPENEFTKSDYYPFIQKLFSDDLRALRNDLVVISFNYDVYLEWLLLRAFETRGAAYGNTPEVSLNLNGNVISCITSGFRGSAPALKSLAEENGFCLLKLHGMIAWPQTITVGGKQATPHCSFEHLFRPNISDTFQALVSSDMAGSTPPILFPWEIMDKSAQILTAEKFPIKEDRSQQWQPGGRTSADPSVHAIFRTIWERARREVANATKISFVGLSMHEYLEGGFKYLFAGKEGSVDLVVTDHNGVRASGECWTVDSLDPNSAPAKVAKLLKNTCPNLRWNPRGRVRLENGATARPVHNLDSVKIRRNFEEFVVKEMNHGVKDG